MDMKAQDLFPYLENMNVCVGPVTEDMLPADANADNTVCIGVCCKKLADAKGFRWVVGCPPGNADVVKGILGDRKEYGVRYSEALAYSDTLYILYTPPMTTAAAERNICRRSGRFWGGA